MFYGYDEIDDDDKDDDDDDDNIHAQRVWNEYHWSVSKTLFAFRLCPTKPIIFLERYC